MKTYIVGHKNPDTDSVISAIVCAKLLNKKYDGNEFVATRAGDINKETEYILSRFKNVVPELLPQTEENIILVDHNEESQRLEYVSESQIAAIFDHHKVGGLNTNKPITMIFKPLGSTATLIAEYAQQNGLEIDQEEASLIISAIISDTLNLSSPTTTEIDKTILKNLNKIAKLDIEELASEMFAAKSDITGIATEELIGKDYKIFEVNNKRFGIGVWETTLPETILDRKNELLELLNKKRSSDGLDSIFFAVVDIVKNNSTFFVASDEEKNILETVFNCNVENELVTLPTVVSRKKQIAPPLEAYFSAKE